MNLAKMRSRVRIKIGDQDKRIHSDNFIDDTINEGLRVFCKRTLLLEDKDTSLTYSSDNDGFAKPSDFIKEKSLQWTSSGGYYGPIVSVGVEEVYLARNEYRCISEDEANSLNPSVYAINGDYIILDSTTQTSPTLFYYKYDADLSADSSEPTIPDEFHHYLVEYAAYELNPELKDSYAKFELGIREAIATKRQVSSVRSRYNGL